MSHGIHIASPLVLDFTVHDGHQSAHQSGRYGGRNDGRGIGAAVLAAVSNHVYRYELQGRDIQDQEDTHLIAGTPASAVVSLMP